MKEKAFKICLKMIEKEGWKSFTFAKASQESGIPLNTFKKHFSTPADVMIHLFQKIDKHVLEHYVVSEKLPAKDQIFEILMERIDAAAPYKPVLQRFWHDWLYSPDDFPSLACQGYSSMTWMLEAVGLNPRGISGIIRVQGLTALYVLTLRTWLDDDSPDLGKTMAFLDKGLSKMEQAAAWLNNFS
ncbi:MAG: hypothetical protein JNJ47_02860 [Alphaproteobacteria bacterium]|nr:hypothetical protein [Alphaproteobacteria bacterium]